MASGVMRRVAPSAAVAGAPSSVSGGRTLSPKPTSPIQRSSARLTSSVRWVLSERDAAEGDVEVLEGNGSAVGVLEAG